MAHSPFPANRWSNGDGALRSGTHFSSSGRNGIWLHVAEAQGGLYAYGASSFPSNPAGNDNYWVQPIFESYSVLNPYPAADLSAVAVSSFEVDLAWNDSNDPSISYQIERSNDGGQTFAVIGQTAAGATSYQDLTVSDGATYQYK